ncbi:MAG: DUF4352 domain-containing protein [Desulfobacterales bacterium]|nr:DUF4352 domain-containing protein [Desulfobacterales bacterium]
MKCPVCGYESHSDDAECIACGSDMALAAASIALEKKRSEEAMERYEKQKKELRIELGIESAEDEPSADEEPKEMTGLQMESSVLNGSSIEVEGLSAEYSPGFLCPQCGFKNREKEQECARCGVVFRKLKETEGRDRVLDDAPLGSQAGYDPYVRQVEEPDPFKGVKAVGEALGRVDFSAAVGGAKGVVATFFEWLKGFSPKAWGGVLIALILLISMPFGWKAAVKVKGSASDYLSRRHEAKLVQLYEKEGGTIRTDVRRLVKEGNYDQARQRIARFDIDPLKTDIGDLKRWIEERELYSQVLKVPAWKFETNYTMFNRLVELNPSKKLYVAKREYYKKRWADRCYDEALHYFKGDRNNSAESSKAVALIEKAVGFYPLNKAYQSLRKDLITADLLFYKGSHGLQMALRDEGRGTNTKKHLRKVDVWLHNTSGGVLYINPELFLLKTKNGKSLKYTEKYSTGLKSKLNPGEKTAGVLYFKTLSTPKSITFGHPVGGVVKRDFP